MNDPIECRAGALGAPIHAGPAQNSRVVGVVSAGQKIVGRVAEGEYLHGDSRWVYVEGYIWLGRTTVPPEERPRRRWRKP